MYCDPRLVEHSSSTTILLPRRVSHQKIIPTLGGWYLALPRNHDAQFHHPKNCYYCSGPLANEDVGSIVQLTSSPNCYGPNNLSMETSYVVNNTLKNKTNKKSRQNNGRVR